MSAASPADSIGNTTESKSRHGRPAGARNWKEDELRAMLDLVGKHQPAGMEGWKKVAREHNAMAAANGWPERDYHACQLKFRRLAATTRPTGDHQIHENTRIAKRLHKKIENDLHVGSLGVRLEDDLGDSDGDDGGSGAHNLSDIEEEPRGSSSSSDNRCVVTDTIPADEMLPDNRRGSAGSRENPVQVDATASSLPAAASSLPVSSRSTDNKRKPTDHSASSSMPPIKFAKTVGQALPQDASNSEKFRSRVRSTKGKLAEVQNAFGSMVKDVASAFSPHSSAQSYATREELRDLRDDIKQLTAQQNQMMFQLMMMIQSSLLSRAAVNPVAPAPASSVMPLAPMSNPSPVPANIVSTTHDQ